MGSKNLHRWTVRKKPSEQSKGHLLKVFFWPGVSPHRFLSQPKPPTHGGGPSVYQLRVGERSLAGLCHEAPAHCGYTPPSRTTVLGPGPGPNPNKIPLKNGHFRLLHPRNFEAAGCVEAQPTPKPDHPPPDPRLPIAPPGEGTIKGNLPRFLVIPFPPPGVPFAELQATCFWDWTCGWSRDKMPAEIGPFIHLSRFNCG